MYSCNPWRCLLMKNVPLKMPAKNSAHNTVDPYFIVTLYTYFPQPYKPDMIFQDCFFQRGWYMASRWISKNDFSVRNFPLFFFNVTKYSLMWISQGFGIDLFNYSIATVNQNSAQAQIDQMVYVYINIYVRWSHCSDFSDTHTISTSQQILFLL